MQFNWDPGRIFSQFKVICPVKKSQLDEGLDTERVGLITKENLVMALVNSEKDSEVR